MTFAFQEGRKEVEEEKVCQECEKISQKPLIYVLLFQTMFLATMNFEKHFLKLWTYCCPFKKQSSISKMEEGDEYYTRN